MNMTEQLALVEVVPVTIFPFSPYHLKPIANYTQVLFDKQNTPTYMVKPTALTTLPVKVRQGKFIIKVAHCSCNSSFTGTITTNDHFTYTYQTTVVLRVVDPWSVAVEYMQGRDPAKQALEFIRSMFEHYAVGSSIETVRNQEIPFSYWSDSRPANIGITIEQQGQVKFIKDVQYIGYKGEILRVSEQKEIQLHTLKADREVQRLKNLIQWEQERARNEFKRQETAKDFLYDLRKDLILVSKQKFEGILHQNIQEGFASNETAEEIARSYFDLLDIFYEDRYPLKNKLFPQIPGLENEASRNDGLDYPNENTEDVVDIVETNDDLHAGNDETDEEEDRSIDVDEF